MRKRITSLLLTLLMLLSLLPTTAFAASYAEISVNDIKLKDNYYLKSNSATTASSSSTEPSSYVAWYKNGVLTLKGYNGKGIETLGVAAGELTVKLIGTNSINNGSLVSDNGGNIIVTSDSGGTLSISKTTSGSNSAIGIETGLSSSDKTGNVTIKGSAKVTINVTHNGTSGDKNAYGIYAKESITIFENASVDITCATPNNTTGGGDCNGLRAQKNVTINTTGTIKIDVTKAGKDNGYSFGVYAMGTTTLTKVGEMEVQWKKHATISRYPGGAVYKGASLSDTDYAINVDTTNCYASYRFGTPRKVTVQDGQLTGPGVKYANDSGYFLAGDKVNITPATKKGRSGEEIPFKEWTSSDVMLDKSATTASNSFTVPGKDVTVTAKHSPFVGTPTFTPIGTTGTEGTLTFKTVVKADAAYEGFRLVKEGNENNESSYNHINPDTTSTSSPYEYSYKTSIYDLKKGNYYVVAYLKNNYYLSEKFTVNYTAPVTTYTVSFNANGGTGTMADVTGISGSYTLPACTFTAPSDKQFKGWSTSADGSVISGTTYEVSSDTTFYAIWESKEYSITVTDGKATIGAGSGISKAAQGTTVTLTANAAPSGKVFDKWEVVSGGITLADANSATTTFTMPASAVSVKATYKTTPVTTYNLTTQVNGGHGTISASKTGLTAGSTETVIFTPDAGYEIDTVTVNGVETGVLSNVLDVTMDADKTVVVTYKAIEYNITVTDGKATIGAGSGISKAAQGTTVTLTANAAPSGKVFDKWEVVSGGITLADANSATTTFTMPASAVSVKATYKTTPVTTYNLTTQVNGGHGTISASKTGLTAGSTETITFTPDAGYKIDTVTVNGTATSVSGNTLNVTMNENKTVVVTYKAIEYNITVTDGKATIGAGSEISKAAEGTAVTLTANAAPSGKVFDKWEVVSGGITLADANSATTTFTMPASAVSVKATYKNAPVTTYNLTTQVNGGHGTISASKTGLAAGSTETVIFTPDAGYEIDTVTVNGVATGVLSNVLDVTMDADKTVIVTYKATGGGEHTHSYGTEWKYDDTNHWHECSCGDKKDTAAHTAGEWIIDTPATATASGSKHKECTVCGYTMATETIPATGGGEHTHSYGTEWKYDADNHWHECSCGDKKDTAAHTAGEWIIDTPATATTSGTKHKECTVCGYTMTTETIPATGGGEHTHSYGTEWKYDGTNHWHECSCGDKTDTAAHSFKWVVDKEATATKKGSKHQECKVCGYKKAAVEIPATGSTTKPSDPTQTNPSTGAESPKTGDNSNMILWIALLFVSGGAVFGITVYSKKKKENAE